MSKSIRGRLEFRNGVSKAVYHPLTVDLKGIMYQYRVLIVFLFPLCSLGELTGFASDEIFMQIHRTV